MHALLRAALLTSCFRPRAAAAEPELLCCFQEESVDVKALRDKFNSQARASDTSRDSNSPKSPRPGLQRTILPMMENNSTHKLMPGLPPPPSASPGLLRLPRPDPVTTSIPSRSAAFPRPPPGSAVKPSVSPGDTRKVRQTGELLQNMMLKHQRPPGTTVAPARSPASPHTSSPITTPHPLRQHSRQRSSKDVSPLRRPLPPEGPLPLKPKRPPYVNLEPFLKSRRGSTVSDLKKSEGKSRAIKTSHERNVDENSQKAVICSSWAY